MCGDIHGVEARVEHAVWHEDITTAAILKEFPIIQMHWLVLREERRVRGRGRKGGEEREGGREPKLIHILYWTNNKCALISVSPLQLTLQSFPCPILPYLQSGSSTTPSDNQHSTSEVGHNSKSPYVDPWGKPCSFVGCYR